MKRSCCARCTMGPLSNVRRAGKGLTNLDGAARRRETGRGLYVCQGLKISTPRPAKSFTFRVTMIRSCSRAVAAIKPSGALMGCPFNGTALRVCPIFPQSLRSRVRCVRRTIAKRVVAPVPQAGFGIGDIDDLRVQGVGVVYNRELLDAGQIELPKRQAAAVGRPAKAIPNV